MQIKSKTKSKPKIAICESDHARLLALANAAEERFPEVAEELLIELERARIVADHSLPAKAVRIGSLVAFERENGVRQTVTLVLPEDADISRGRVSILTPIGAALIGLSEGQAMQWTARDGTQHVLSVLSVSKEPDA